MKIRFSHIAAIALGFALISSRIQAEEVLDFETCWGLAKGHDASVVEKQASLDRAAARIEGGKSPFRPQVAATSSAETAAQTKKDQPRIPAGTDTGSDKEIAGMTRTDSYSIGVSVKQSLFHGFKDQAALTQREEEYAAARYDLEEAMTQLKLELRKNFDAALYYQDLIALNKTVIDRRRENLRLVALRYEGGRENQGAMLKSQAALSTSETDVAQAQRQLTLAKAKIQNAIGRPVGADVKFQGDLRVGALEAKQPDFKAMAESSTVARRSEANVRSSKAAIKLARGGYLPDLSLTGSAARTGTELPLDTNRFSIGLNLTVPIYDGGATRSDVEAAASEVARYEAQLRSTIEGRSVSIEQSYFDVTSSISQLGDMKKLAEASRVQAEIARERYSLGLIGFQEWDTVENEWINNQRQLLTSRKDAAIALAGWESMVPARPEGEER